MATAKREEKTEAPVDRRAINHLEKAFGNRRVLEKSEIQNHSARIKRALSEASKNLTGSHGYPDMMVFLDDACDLPLICGETKKAGGLKKAIAEAEHYCSSMLDKDVYCPLIWAVSPEQSELLWFNKESKKGEPIRIKTDSKSEPVRWNPSPFSLSSESLLIERLEKIFYSNSPVLDEVPIHAFSRAEVEDFCGELNQKLHSDSNGKGGIQEHERPMLFASFLMCCLNSKTNGFPALATNALKNKKEFINGEWEQVDGMVRSAINNKIPGVNPSKFFLAGSKNRITGFLSILETVAKFQKRGETFEAVIARMVQSSNLIGDAYEVFHTYTGGNDMGQYFTPRHLVDFVVRLVEELRGRKISESDVIYDPACGVGGFLVLALRHALEGETSPKKRQSILDTLGKQGLYGNEFVESTADIARVNMLLRGDGKSGIVTGSALNADYPPIDVRDEQTGEVISRRQLSPVAQRFGCKWIEDAYGTWKFSEGMIQPSIVLMNPPFPSKKSNFESYHFIEHALDVARDGAWIAAIVPESVLSSSGHFSAFRKRALGRATLRAAVVLPSDIFLPRAGVNTAIVVLQKSLSGHDKNSTCYFAWAPFDGMSMHKGKKQRIKSQGIPDCLSMFFSHWAQSPDKSEPRRFIRCVPGGSGDKAREDFFAGGEWSPFCRLNDEDAEFLPSEIERLAKRIQLEATTAANMKGLGGKW